MLNFYIIIDMTYTEFSIAVLKATEMTLPKRTKTQSG